MPINDKSKIYLGIPLLNPDKVLGEPIRGVFTTDTTPSLSGGAVYNGTVVISNPAGKKAFPISRFTEDGNEYYTDLDQAIDGVVQNAVIITAVSASQVKYRWATFSSPVVVTYETVLVSMD